MSSNQAPGEEELRAAFADLSSSLQHLRGVLVEFQHSLVEMQMDGGSDHAADAMLTARMAISNASRF
jgi:hypothetical protein